jgi:hypothetical protein
MSKSDQMLRKSPTAEREKWIAEQDKVIRGLLDEIHVKIKRSDWLAATKLAIELENAATAIGYHTHDEQRDRIVRER